MRRSIVVLAILILGSGCQRLLIRTQNRVAFDGPVETRVTADIPPVSPTAGRVKPVIVQSGTPGNGRVTIVDVDGLILNTPFVGPLSVGENPVALFREKLDAIECDGCTKAVVLRINSPGGGVAACSAMRRDLERFKERTKLPVVACLMDTAAGGAYYVASVADVVVASSTTITGGLGVILNLFNLKDLMAQFNVIPQSIKAGELVDIGSSARPLKPAEQELLQAMADELHKQIWAELMRSRPKLDSLKAFDGRIFTGKQAVERGLVDRLGDLDDAIQTAGQLGFPGATCVRPEVVLYRRTNDPATTIYAITANIPLQGSGILPSLPGLDRSKLPTFLSIWQPELTMEKLGGK
ncbi:MAG: S49 family peptidase [Planctomycetes bacterium]|nr:S49 family peptidase [Planctomycetota bacterium]